MSGHSGEKIAQKSRNSREVNCRSCGCTGQLTQSAILCNLRTKYKRSKNVFPVTSIALSCAHICARLLQLLAQSLIGSPGTLPDPMNHVKIFKGWPLQDAPSKLVQLWFKSFQKEDFCLAEMKKPTMLSNKRSTA